MGGVLLVLEVFPCMFCCQVDKELASGEYFMKESERMERKRAQKKV